ncbi:hypothetical protein RRG08_016190 [Elysia crispata]|uniref:Uncharacterized protein n=1 Tax=Elysia crispata TaxID=231223 RepID=A0AAE1DJM8_9GAST|nr:hypothetical protein RRG08_016190 [Elysia crispata]
MTGHDDPAGWPPSGLTLFTNVMRGYRLEVKTKSRTLTSSVYEYTSIPPTYREPTEDSLTVLVSVGVTLNLCVSEYAWIGHAGGRIEAAQRASTLLVVATGADDCCGISITGRQSALGMILNKTAITSSTTTYWPLPSGSDLACPCCFCCWSQDCSCGLDIVCSASPKNYFVLLPQSVCRGTHMVVRSPYLRGRDGRMIMLLLVLVVGHSAGGRKHRLKEEIASGILAWLTDTGDLADGRQYSLS